jgi:hypothetical protein
MLRWTSALNILTKKSCWWDPTCIRVNCPHGVVLMTITGVLTGEHSIQISAVVDVVRVRKALGDQCLISAPSGLGPLG